MAKGVLALLVVCALAGAQELGQVSGEPRLDRAASFVGGSLTCSQPQSIRVPEPAVERAKLKIRLMNLLRESLFDDAKGVVNIAREKEIRKLANKMKNSKPDY